MLKPKKIKYNKQHRGRLKGQYHKKSLLKFGSYGLQAKESCWLTAKQIEALRRVITRVIKREGTLWFRIFPHKPISTRVPESRMGAGKGAITHWVATIKDGIILCEISDISPELAKKVLTLANHKLPIKTKIIRNKCIKKI
uniref:Ribosomal protein L16 n=1 Tax=Pteridomonas sp. YPF1301 TaxID=2766739 RepID=A0A7G1MPQ2_9STRA|nr:ribosomal protein L16 [Pteridomonas sp. YPF1301]